MNPAKTHRPPSRDRYAASHPSVTVHFAADTYARLVALRKSTGLSVNQLVRASLGSLEEHVATIRERGRQQGFEEGRKAGYDAGWKAGYLKARATYRLVYPCSGCGKLVAARAGDPDAERAMALLVEEEWGHTDCIRN